MEKGYTQNLLVKYVYGELEFVDKLEVEGNLSIDFYLREDLDSMKAAFEKLPKFTVSPGKKVLDRILKFSRDNEVQPKR